MRSLLLLVAGGLLSALSVAAADQPDEVSLSSLVARMDSMQEQLDEQKHEIAVLRDNENGQQVTEPAQPTTAPKNNKKNLGWNRFSDGGRWDWDDCALRQARSPNVVCHSKISSLCRS